MYKNGFGKDYRIERMLEEKEIPTRQNFIKENEGTK